MSFTKIDNNNISPTGVAAGTYTSANITVNESGQIVSASSGSGGGGGPGGGSGTIGPGGSGGSGVVIIKYLGNPRASGGEITTVNGYTIHKFTSTDVFIA